MPIAYAIDGSRGLVWTRCIGPVSPADVEAHFRQLESEPDLPEHLDVLLDLLDITSTPESDQLRDVASIIRGVAPQIHWGACAIVAEKDVIFGMSRMLAAFAEDAFQNVNVFRRCDQAEDWLASVGTTSTATPAL